jgi:tellurite resistance protein TerC
VGALMRWAKIIGGFLLLAAGIAMLVLPGPGWLTIAAGLAILAGEFLWARQWLDQIKKTATRLARRPAPPPRPE